jgi:hypothetical protein
MQNIQTMSNNEQDQDIRLVIHIENRKPIELMDLTKSLVSLANQFNDYVKTTSNIPNREAKLYVKQIKTGSVILDLVEIATAGALPFIEKINTIVGFADFLKTGYDFFLGRGGDVSPEFSTRDCSDFAQIINPIAKDNGSQIIIQTTINDHSTNVFVMSSLEANAVQNVIKTTNKLSAIPEHKGEHEKVVMYFDTTKSNVKVEKGNKGIIESIDNKPANILFDTPELQWQVLKGEDNPLTTAYVVDVKVDTIKSKVCSYKITKLHETFTIDGSV